jgi:5-methylcytosine-specific restriction endonuclease McrBC regulatory subunit McrC
MNQEPIANQIKAALEQIDTRKILAKIKEKNEELQQQINEIRGSDHLQDRFHIINGLIREISQLQEVATLKIALANKMIEDALQEVPSKEILELLLRLPKELQ